MARTTKHRWHDGRGNEITAGGILAYDEGGFWAVLERREGRDLLMDIGGKYECTDGDIWFTIARELCEETYHMAELTRGAVMDLALEPGALSYVTDNRGRPVYISLAVHTDALRKRGVVMSPADFRRCRERVVRDNPGAPPAAYPTTDLLYVPWPAGDVAAAAPPGGPAPAAGQERGGAPLGERLRLALGAPLIEAARRRAEGKKGAAGAE